jgi:very-short-patch-repair endonuclease
MSRGEVLVAIVNSRADFDIARELGWYRIPVSSVEKWLRGRWPPRWLAFYQPKVFGDEAYAVKYYAEVLDLREVLRRDLFPDRADDPKADWPYCQILLGPLKELARPIPSKRLRRIVFIATTWDKLACAEEINDLFDESPLEDRLWGELKRLKIPAERQEPVEVNSRSYFLDFAIYCTRGGLNVETDGDTWHLVAKRVPLDNQRDNDLATAGWARLRFNGHQVREEMTEYCIPTITDNIKRLNNIDEGRVLPRDIRPEGPQGTQLSLFDD